MFHAYANQIALFEKQKKSIQRTIAAVNRAGGNNAANQHNLDAVNLAIATEKAARDQAFATLQNRYDDESIVTKPIFTKKSFAPRKTKGMSDEKFDRLEKTWKRYIVERNGQQIDETTVLNSTEDASWNLYLDELDRRFPTVEDAIERMRKFEDDIVMYTLYQKEVLEPLQDDPNYRFRKLVNPWDDYIKEVARRFPTTTALSTEIERLQLMLATEEEDRRRTAEEKDSIATRIERYKQVVMPLVRENILQIGLKNGEAALRDLTLFSIQDVMVRLFTVGNMMGLPRTDYQRLARRFINVMALFYAENNGRLPLPTYVASKLSKRGLLFWNMVFATLPSIIDRKPKANEKEEKAELTRLMFFWNFGTKEFIANSRLLENVSEFEDYMISQYTDNGVWPSVDDLASRRIAGISNKEQWANILRELGDAQNKRRDTISLAITDAIDEEMFECGAALLGRKRV